jgi:hypothetical protein
MFCMKSSDLLKKWRLTYIMKKQVNSKQTTVLRHVTNIKNSHVKEDVVSDIIQIIHDKSQCEAPLTGSHGTE